MAIITKRYYPVTNAIGSNSEWRMIWNGSYFTSATLDREDAIQFSTADKSEIINNLAIMQSMQIGFNLASLNFYPDPGCYITARNISLITPPKSNLLNGGFAYLSAAEYILTLGARTLTIQDNITNAINNGIGIRISGSANTDSGSAPPNDRYGTATATYSGIYLDIKYSIPEGSTPTISNITLPTFNISLDNPISWDSTNQTSYNLKAYNSQGALLYEKNGGSEKNCIIPASSITVVGSVRFVVTVYNVLSIGTLSASAETTITTVGYTPAITTLEPDSVNQNINMPVTVSWTSVYQSTFKLTVEGTVYTGTTAKSLVLPSNTLTFGTKTMTLEVTYIGTGYTATTSKTVTFLAYGNPPIPTLLNKAVISTATPLIKWDSVEQTHYDFKLLEGMSNVEITGEVLSASKQYQILGALENNKTYNIKLRVKNQFDLWSEYATSTFTTSFIVPNAPSITGFADTSNGSIILNVSTETSAEYKNTEIWRKEPFGEWVRMAYNLASTDVWTDNYVKSDAEYQYKARSIGQTGGIAESEPITLSTKVKGYNFYNIEDMSRNITFRYNVDVVPTYNRNEALTMYAGCNAPSYETDNIIYQTLSMSFATITQGDIEKLINLIKTTKVFLYKDSKGRKVFGMITGNTSPKTENTGIITLSFGFVELSFLEQDVYAGANTGLKLIVWDGTWMFDGTYAYGGA